MTFVQGEIVEIQFKDQRRKIRIHRVGHAGAAHGQDIALNLFDYERGKFRDVEGNWWEVTKQDTSPNY